MERRRTGSRAVRAATLASALVAAFASSGAAEAREASPLLPRLFAASRTTGEVPPATVLARYEAAVASAARPPFLTFDYAVEQVGAHDISQAHHVYRAGPSERDETLVADGYRLRTPDVRIIRNKTYRYDLAAVAPRTSQYAFHFAGKQRNGDHDDYLFATKALGSRSFAVTSVLIDGARYLPSEIAFHIVAGAVRGSGKLTYGRFETYWLVREANVTTHGIPGASVVPARERIVWTQYQFPDTLPPSTFTSRAGSADAPVSVPTAPVRVPASLASPLPKLPAAKP